MGKNRYEKMSRQLLTVRAHLFRVINGDDGLVMFVRYKKVQQTLHATFGYESLSRRK